jgi:SAM-dependent methyltransferase
MTNALAYYGAALRQAADGRASDLRLIDSDGLRKAIHLRPGMWCALQPGDAELLARCHGFTLDIGCGPGRLAAALADRWIPALGIDISSEAVRQARRRGATAEIACILTSDLPPQTWQHLLLIDGNIGIGGDPTRLLGRCRDLMVPGGDVLIEVDPPGTSSWAGSVNLGYRGSVSSPFAWAVVGADDLDQLAGSAAMSVLETWTAAGRWFARLAAA